MRRLLLAICVLSGMELPATMSTPVRLIPDPSSSIHWRTYTKGSCGIEWEWPAEARFAKLMVFGKDGVKEYMFDTSVSSFVPELPSVSGDEDVWDMTLEFYSGSAVGEGLIESATLSASGIGIVRGANSDAVDLRPVLVSSRKWRKVYNEKSVLPIPAGATALSLDGDEVGFGVSPGWYVWKRDAVKTSYGWTVAGDGFSYGSSLLRANMGIICIIK